MAVEIVTRRVSEAWVQFESTSTQGFPLGEAVYEKDEEQWVFTQQAAFLLADELEAILHELQRLNLHKEPDVERSMTKESDHVA